jgi:2-keto-3-deoxy-L-rhamnonate aldolase RhmA
MSTQPSLKERVRRGDVVVALRVPISTPRREIETALGKGRYDLIYLDGQHSPFTEDSLVAFCAMAEELGMPVQLRIPHTRHTYLIGRYLDFGPAAILVPETETEATVDEAVAFAYYPPFGRRSVGGDARYGRKALGERFNRLNYAAWWNEQVVLGIQLESVNAITSARQLAKSGVDYVAFGPNDLSFSLEANPEFPLKTVDDCMRNVAAQLKGSGIPLGMAVTTEPDEREKYLDMGITIFQETPR